MNASWQDIAFGSDPDSRLWELFHENSKNDRFSIGLSDKDVLKFLARFHESLAFDGYPTVRLPKRLPALKMAIGKVMATRVSVREMVPSPIELKHLAALLYYGYGPSRRKAQIDMPRSLRIVPSAGALYPLEIFVQIRDVSQVPAGLYHYNPLKHHLRLLRNGSNTEPLERCFFPGTVPAHASLIVFVTALFGRSTFKYGPRGYRFVLLEAGHVAQNINLTASALKLGSLNLGGFIDRETDAFLHLDGVSHSTVYSIAVGKAK